jgi:hypothetical protein
MNSDITLHVAGCDSTREREKDQNSITVDCIELQIGKKTGKN